MGDVNPIRYRSYYYDRDNNLYYLLTRYYDPTIGQFISPDGFDYLKPETVGLVNLYVYCSFDPINNADSVGQEWYDNLYDSAKRFIDAFMDSLYFNFGLGTGFGIDVEIFNQISFSAIVAWGLNVDVYPDLIAGNFEKILIGLNIFSLNASAGIDMFYPFGGQEQYTDEIEIQDITFGIGFSAFLGFGGYVDGGFNISKFLRLLQ